MSKYYQEHLVKHVEHGILRVTGHQKGKLTLSKLETSKQVVLQAKPEDYKILRRLNFKYKSIVQSVVKQEMIAIQLSLF